MVRPVRSTIGGPGSPDEPPVDVTDEIAYVRPADDGDDPSARARHAAEQVATYLAARRRRLRHELGRRGRPVSG